VVLQFCYGVSQIQHGVAASRFTDTVGT